MEIKSELLIKQYTAADYDSCIRLFQSNIPKYFDASELDEFKEFLEKHATESYWVVERDGQQVACGGIHIRPDGSGGLSYGMVDNHMHKNGIGKTLTIFRLLQLLGSPTLSNITLDTSQHTYQFYERFGFKVSEVQKDFYGVGIDCYSMNLMLPDNPLDLKNLKQALFQDFTTVHHPLTTPEPPAP